MTKINICKIVDLKAKFSLERHHWPNPKLSWNRPNPELFNGEVYNLPSYVMIGRLIGQAHRL